MEIEGQLSVPWKIEVLLFTYFARNGFIYLKFAHNRLNLPSIVQFLVITGAIQQFFRPIPRLSSPSTFFINKILMLAYELNVLV